MKKQFSAIVLAFFLATGIQAQTYKFDFTSSKNAKEGYTKIQPTDIYNEEIGNGY